MIHRVHWRITLPIVGLVTIILICAHLGWLSLPVSILFILITSGLVIFCIERLIAPVKEITQSAQQITDLISPNDKINYALENENEMEQLSLTFNGMVRQLHTQIEALQAERMTLNAVLQHMTDGVILVDEQGKIQLFNSAAEHIYGMTANNAIGHTLAEALRYHQVVELWQNQQRTGKGSTAYLELGQMRQSLQSTAISLEDALPGCTLLIFQDTTQLRRLETMRRDFISNISHELRTPIASLKALTDTLQDGALEDPPAAKRFLSRMEIEVDALTQMVAELLELSRIESGKVPLSVQSINPCDLLAAAVERLHLQAERAGLTMHIDCSANLPQVLADPTRIGQILVNLLHNAIKFTQPPGRITLIAHQDESKVIFAVKDTGIGIPKDELKRIFERFYKIDQARHSSGTGLGLAIARHLVEAHEGKIWAESEEGHGSIFYFSLPLA